MRVISLFSGAGGFDLGLLQAGHTIVWANDIDNDCVQTYRNNIGSHVVLGDIAEIDADSIPEGEVVIGGFPCQGFSRANLRRSKHDKRNKLYLEFLRVVESKRPLYFLAENVRGLLSMDDGNVIRMIVQDFEDSGYRVQYELFNTADYGVPQTRHRVIVAGTRKDLPEELDYQYPKPTHIEAPEGQASWLHPWVTVSQALEDIPEPRDDGTDLPNHIFSKYKVTNRDFTGHRRTDAERPSPTILARGNGGGGVCAIQHPSNHRRMSVRESASIQTFPLDFEFEGSMTSCYRQVGNAVPVLFAHRLGEKLKELERRLSKCV